MKAMKVARGTARANRRQDIGIFHSIQCQRRDADQHRWLYGDKAMVMPYPMPMPTYYREHLTK